MGSRWGPEGPPADAYSRISDPHRYAALDADLVVVRTGFGVRLRAGRWAEQSFPSCGCDACDEDVDDLIDELHEYVEDVVAGRLEEELRGGLRGGLLSVRRPMSAGSESLTRARVQELGPPDRHVWSAWSRRPAGR